jgi:sugar phosphate isomerase/epimerase
VLDHIGAGAPRVIGRLGANRGSTREGHGFDERRLVLDGVLETRRETSERAWSLRSVGDGHPVAFWRDLVAALGDAGYDGALSIEQEDPFRSPEDGLARAIATLRAALGRQV